MLNVYTFALIFIFLCTVFESERSALKLSYISNKIVFFMLAVYLILVAGLRYGIETDYWSYAKIFKSTSENHEVEGIEKGFHSLILFYKNMFSSKNFNGFIFMLAFISVGLKLFYISKLKEPFIALIFYFVGFYIMYEFNTVRQGIAICFLFFAAEQIEKRNFIKYLFWVFIAVLFHLSSIIFLPVWFFCKMKMTRRKIIVFLILAIIFAEFSISIADSLFKMLPLPAAFQGYMSKILTYLSLAQKGSLFSVGLVRRVVAIVLLYFILGQKGVQTTHFKIFFLGSLLYILFVKSEIIANRLSGSFEAFIIPLLGTGIRKRNYLATISLAMLIMLYIALFFVSLRNGNALPYQTYFMENSL